ncbi:MAG: hypothetical protein HOV87_36000 [Catenulispora sp.]|nr:hypothetical protein [Catenulispora sp.]
MTQADVERDLDAWLQGMAEAMSAGLRRELPDFAADGRRDSLAALETTLLERLPDKYSTEDRDVQSLIDIAARYIGETLIWNFQGCYWRAGFGTFEGVPTVAIPDGVYAPTCPEQLVDLIVRKRTGTVLTDVFDGIAELVPGRSEPLEGLDDRYADATMPPAPDNAEALAIWLQSMQVALEKQLPGYLPDGLALTYDRASLAGVEAAILARLAEAGSEADRRNAGFIDRCARYVGEVFIRAGEDARWDVGEGMHQWYPMVAYHDGKTMALSPLSLVLTAADRKRGTFLTTMFDNKTTTAKPRTTPLAPLAERFPV